MLYPSDPFIVPNAVQTWPQQQSTAIHEKNIHPKPSCHGTASVGRLDSNLCWTWSHIYSFVPMIRLLEVARGSHPLTKPWSFQARKWVWRLMKVSAWNKASLSVQCPGNTSAPTVNRSKNIMFVAEGHGVKQDHSETQPLGYMLHICVICITSSLWLLFILCLVLFFFQKMILANYRIFIHSIFLIYKSLY